MAVNKNFVVKNGLEVKSNLIVADTSADAVGIGTSTPIRAFDFKEVRDDNKGAEILIRGSRSTKDNSLSGVPDGMNIFIIGETLLRNKNIKFAYVVKDNKELNLRYNQFKSLFPNLEVLKLPSWDCPPYDLSSPDNKIATERINSFLNLSNKEEKKD